MAPTAFQSRPLPRTVSQHLRRRLKRAHTEEPFSACDPRLSVRRAAAIVEAAGLEVRVYRGALDLAGSEIDHIWVTAEDRVIDVAFPLFVPSFVDLLRRYVTGEVEAADLDAAATGAGLDRRVLGEFPAPLRYRGAPVWSDR